MTKSKQVTINEYPNCDICEFEFNENTISRCWHFSGIINENRNGHIHCCSECADKLGLDISFNFDEKIKERKVVETLNFGKLAKREFISIERNIMDSTSRGKNMSILLGNTFPVGLIRRKAVFNPIDIALAKSMLENGFDSFWGHSDTLNAVNTELGIDATPKEERPAIILNENWYPTLFGKEYKTIIVFSPSYAKGFRPTYGKEVTTNKIKAWEPLLIEFE